MSTLFRTQAQHEKYIAYIQEGGLKSGCVLCEKTPLQEFNHWKIVPNDFPYDKIAKTHHMILPKRHATEPDLSETEKQEFQELKVGYINQNYEFMIEPASKMKSIPEHFHLHLIVTKE